MPLNDLVLSHCPFVAWSEGAGVTRGRKWRGQLVSPFIIIGSNDEEERCVNDEINSQKIYESRTGSEKVFFKKNSIKVISI